MTSAVDIGLLILRCAVAVVCLAHGVNHIFGGGKIAGTARWFNSLGMKPGIVHAWVASLTEIGSGLLLGLGFLTELGAAGLLGTMVVAWVTNHARNGFFIFRPGEGYEYVMILSACAVGLAGTGPGRLSVDHVLGLFDPPTLGWFAAACGVGAGGAAVLLALCWRPASFPVKWLERRNVKDPVGSSGDSVLTAGRIRRPAGADGQLASPPPARSIMTDEERAGPAADHYRWVALTNTTVGVLMVTINSSIVLISLPAIFRGIGLDPLQPANVSYLLWILQGFLVVTAVLVVSFGRLGDTFGRVRIYNLGFAIFTACSVGLSLVFAHGTGAALLIIVLRIVQGVGGAMLFANSAAILTDAFPSSQRGMALGVNSIAAVAGSFIGLVIGGLLADTDWHLIFLVSVPVGLFGTVWGYTRLREVSAARGGRMDWWGSVLFATGLVAVLVGLTYGIQPYGGHTMGWTNPAVLGAVIGGVVLLGVFVLAERRVAEPMVDFTLLRNRTFASGNLASLLSSIGRGGLLFALIIWLQGIWLPLRGYSFAQTPLWSAIYMLPLSIGFLVAGPLAGIWSDRLGPRPFTIGGLLAATAAFVLLGVLPVDFQYWAFALLLLAYGLGMGAFSSPNAAEVMGAVDPAQRGSAAGIRATALNCGQTLAISLFFTMLTAGLAARLPRALSSGLTGAGVPAPEAAAVAHLPPVATLFATFLGYNPMQTLLGPALHSLPTATARTVTSTAFFPHVISGPFHDGLRLTFGVAAAMMLLATAACVLGRPKPAGAVEQAPAGPERTGARADATDALAAEAARLEAQVRHWQQLVTTEDAAVPRIVTVSAPLGAGGDQVAQRLAGQLDLPLVDRAIPAAVARELAVPVASAEARDEQREPVALRLLVGAANTEPLFGLEVADVDFDDEDRFRLATEAALWKLAATTGGVIVGRAGAIVLAGHPRAIHVRIVASRETRSHRVQEYGGLAEPEALRLIDRTDRARTAYAHHLYGADLSDPSLYDLVVATDKLGIEDVAGVVTAFLAVSRLQ